MRRLAKRVASRVRAFCNPSFMTESHSLLPGKMKQNTSDRLAGNIISDLAPSTNSATALAELIVLNEDGSKGSICAKATVMALSYRTD